MTLGQPEARRTSTLLSSCADCEWSQWGRVWEFVLQDLNDDYFLPLVSCTFKGQAVTSLV